MSRYQCQCPKCSCTLTTKSTSQSFTCPKCGTLISIKSPLAPASQVSKPRGVYQQDGLLVANLKWHQFDSVCHKSGESTDHEYRLLAIDSTSYVGKPLAVLMRALLGAFGRMLYILAFGKRIQIEIPTHPSIVERFEARQRLRKRVIFLVTYFSIAAVFALLGIELFRLGAPVGLPVFLSVAFTVAFLCAWLAVVLSSILFLNFRTGLYNLETSEGNYVWISGADSNVLCRYEKSKWAED